MEGVLNKIKYTRILSAIGLVLCLLSVFFPYETFSATAFGYTASESITLIGYWEGYIVLVATFASFIFIFKDVVEKYAPGVFKNNFANKIKNANPKLGIIPPVIAGIVAIILQVRTKEAMGISSLLKLTYGFGFYALWSGVIISIIAIFVYKKDGAPANMNVSNNNGGLNQFMDGNNQNQVQTGMNQYMNYNDPMVNQQPAQPQFNQPMQPQPQMQPANKYCPTCGAQCDSGANFCNNCGNRI